MKSKDYAIVGVAIIAAAIISIFASRLLFGKSLSKQQVEVVPSISSSFQTPPAQYFNSSSIDPTQFISIGNNQNQAPFASTPGQ